MSTDQGGPVQKQPGDAIALPIGDLAQRTSASRSIARMVETRALTPRELESRRLIYRDDAAPDTANAFREIRTRLLALGDARNFISMVTPVSPKSGGSFVARNLAAAFAFDEAKTALLIDCNLRQPAQHKALGIEPAQGGLIDYLEEPDVEIQNVLYRTGIPRLRLIPAGRQREMSAEYFSSFRLRTLLDSLRHRYADRYIFLDGPSMKGAPDARILSDLADFVVVVAAYGRDTASSISQAIAGFDPAKIAGVVFNHVP